MQHIWILLLMPSRIQRRAYLSMVIYVASCDDDIFYSVFYCLCHLLVNLFFDQKRSNGFDISVIVLIFFSRVRRMVLHYTCTPLKIIGYADTLNDSLQNSNRNCRLRDLLQKTNQQTYRPKLRIIIAIKVKVLTKVLEQRKNFVGIIITLRINLEIPPD